MPQFALQKLPLIPFDIVFRKMEPYSKISLAMTSTSVLERTKPLLKNQVKKFEIEHENNNVIIIIQLENFPQSIKFHICTWLGLPEDNRIKLKNYFPTEKTSRIGLGRTSRYGIDTDNVSDTTSRFINFFVDNFNTTINSVQAPSSQEYSSMRYLSSAPFRNCQSVSLVFSNGFSVNMREMWKQFSGVEDLHLSMRLERNHAKVKKQRGNVIFEGRWMKMDCLEYGDSENMEVWHASGATTDEVKTFIGKWMTMQLTNKMGIIRIHSFEGTLEDVLKDFGFEEEKEPVFYTKIISRKRWPVLNPKSIIRQDGEKMVVALEYGIIDIQFWRT